MKRFQAGVGFLGVVALATILGACTEAKLEEIPQEPIYRDDKLEVQGELCTQAPETLTFPLRVLFIVDASVSMEVTDPPDLVTGVTGRERAVRETWEQLLESGPSGVRVGVIRFSAEAQSRTASDLDGDSLPDTFFTADRVLLDSATASLGETDRTTNYANALGEAYFEIRNELQRADQESLPLSKYVVIFLSDGVPDTDDSDTRGNAREDILESVEALQDLAGNFRVGDFTFHTAYLSGSQVAAQNQEAEELLQDMAEVGGGSYRSFSSGEALNFLFVDFTILKRIFTLKSLVAVNLNMVVDLRQIPEIPPELLELEADVLEELAEVVEEVVESQDIVEDLDAADLEDGFEVSAEELGLNPFAYVDVNGSGWAECGEPLVDSDLDGLADLVEVEIGTDPLVRDSDDDGLNDFLEWSFLDSGLDPLVAGDACFVPNACVDEDDDGYCDCTLDSDADGVCDCVGNDDEPCVDADGHDCLDEDEDGWCDCPDIDEDGRCDYGDRDGDGLHDCEEVFYGTAQNGVDSDADGLPDPSEIRFLTNPTKEDTLIDADFDLTTNGVEVGANTNPLCDDAALRSRIAVRYELEEEGLSETQTCYRFNISNITLVPTLARPAEIEEEIDPFVGDGSNRILLFAGEVSFDDPSAFARYRVACVQAYYFPEGGYKSPPSGRVRLTEADFVPVSEFDPELHCK